MYDFTFNLNLKTKNYDKRNELKEKSLGNYFFFYFYNFIALQIR